MQTSAKRSIAGTHLPLQLFHLCLELVHAPAQHPILGLECRQKRGTNRSLLFNHGGDAQRGKTGPTLVPPRAAASLTLG